MKFSWLLLYTYPHCFGEQPLCRFVCSLTTWNISLVWALAILSFWYLSCFGWPTVLEYWSKIAQVSFTIFWSIAFVFSDWFTKEILGSIYWWVRQANCKQILNKNKYQIYIIFNLDWKIARRYLQKELCGIKASKI